MSAQHPILQTRTSTEKGGLSDVIALTYHREGRSMCWRLFSVSFIVSALLIMGCREQESKTPAGLMNEEVGASANLNAQHNELRRRARAPRNLIQPPPPVEVEVAPLSEEPTPEEPTEPRLEELPVGSTHAPVADGGEDQFVTVGDDVYLSANNSYDEDGDALTYLWSIVSKPDNSEASIDEVTATDIVFNADISGTFELALVVNDGTSDSITDFISIEANNEGIDITDKIFTNKAGRCINYVGSYYSNVTDTKRSSEFSGDVIISADGTPCTIDSNTIPNHDFNDDSASFANNVSEVDSAFDISINPINASTPTPLEIGTTEGVLLNGITIDLLAAACYNIGNEPLGREKIGCGPDQNDNPWRYDPMSSLNHFGTDAHHAHTQPNGKYHYHGNPVAMFAQECGDTSSPVIGFAADGYPIFGSCFKDPNTQEVREAQSSYILKNGGGPRQAVVGYETPVGGVGDINSDDYDGQFRGDWIYDESAGDLDECNGMTVDDQYGYYVTDSFPWVLNCLKGEIDVSFGAASNQLDRRMHSHEDGVLH